MEDRYYTVHPLNAGLNVAALRSLTPPARILQLVFNVFCYPLGRRDITMWIVPFKKTKGAVRWCEEVEALFKRRRTYKNLTKAELVSSAIREPKKDSAEIATDRCHVVLSAALTPGEFMTDFEVNAHHALILHLEKDLKMLKTIADRL